MGAVGGLLGLSGGANGGGFAAPSVGANVQEAQQAAQNQLGQQTAFSNALNPYALQSAQSQSQLLGQLQQGAAGQGPNPALAQLNQTTGQNTANQAALMAGQRGAGANPALIARQAAQQGAANQQNAAGSAATLAAQQQINQEQMLQAQQAQGVSQGQNALNSATNSANQIYGTASGLQSNINQANAGLTSGQMGMQGQVLGGVAQGLSGGAGLLAGAEGGVIPMAQGGDIAVNFQPSTPISGSIPSQPQSDALYKGMSSFGKYLMTPGAPGAGDVSPSVSGGGGATGQIAMPAEYTKGGKVPVLLSPGEKVLSPDKAKAVAQGKVNPMAEGKKVPGTPKVSGAKNSYQNDTYKDALEPGSIVIPRSVTQSKDAEKKAMAFVQAAMTKNRGMK